MKRILTLSILVCLLSSSCENVNSTNQNTSVDSSHDNKKNDEYLNKYSGGYTVELDNVSSNNSAEVYILKNDGTAKWMYITNDGSGGAEISSEKSGEWTATESSITITCEGNSGPITEGFKLKDGLFYDTLTGKRYLKLKK